MAGPQHGASGHLLERPCSPMLRLGSGRRTGRPAGSDAKCGRSSHSRQLGRGVLRSATAAAATGAWRGGGARASYAKTALAAAAAEMVRIPLTAALASHVFPPVQPPQR